MFPQRNIAIMTVFLPRENIFFLQEWLNYHILIGFTHFYLYNNMGSRQVEYGNNPEINGKNKRGENFYALLADKSDAQVQQDLDRLLAPYVAQGYVTQIIWQPRNAQGEITFGIGEAYAHYIREFSADTAWTAVTDLDEFIVPVKHDSVQALTAACAEEGFTYITLPQKCFGPRFNGAGQPVPEVLKITDSFDWVTFAVGCKALIRSDTMLAPDADHRFHVHLPRVDETKARRVEDVGLVRFNHYKFNQWEIDWARGHVRADFELNQPDDRMAPIAAKVRGVDITTYRTPTISSGDARFHLSKSAGLGLTDDELLAIYDELSSQDGPDRVTPPDSIAHLMAGDSALPPLDVASQMDGPTSMNIELTPLASFATLYRPVSSDQLLRAGQQLAGPPDFTLGWEFLAPLAFEATWNGGKRPQDIEISVEGGGQLPWPFVTSEHGQGILTIRTGYSARPPENHWSWLRGPVNRPKAPAHLLEQQLCHAMTGESLDFHWQFTAANQTIRFEQGEAFGLLLPQNAGGAGQRMNIVESVVAVPAVEEVAAPSDAELLAVYQELSSQTEPLLESYPPVSCLCPTYARVDLLEEAIHSFLLQDYPGEKELLILNDYAGQTLAFDHPEVRIVNFPRPFHSLGEKFKAAVGLASHDLLFVWSDDDIYLPHRLRYSVERFDPEIGFFKADRAWFWNDGSLSGPSLNTFHGGSCWSRELHHQVQGYPHTDLGCDQDFEKRIRVVRPGVELAAEVAAEEVYYLYRWGGTGAYHLSNLRTVQAVATHIERQVALGHIPQGKIALQPGWKADYRELVHTFLATGQAAQPEAARKPPPMPFPPPFFPIDPPQPALAPARVRKLLDNGGGPKISVILPTLNDSVLLKRTVEQFQDTLPQPSEIVVVDNGSSDGSSDFLGNGCPPNLRFIQVGRPLGVSGARNRGLQEATGRIVVFSDAHMDVPVRWWEPIAELLDNPAVGVVGPGIGVMGNPDVPVAVGQRIAEPNLRTEWLPYRNDEPLAVPVLGGGFMAMRRDVLDKAGAFDGDMPDWGYEDLEICLRYWLLGYEVWAAPSLKVLHYFRSSAPYSVRYEAVIHNVLRTAILHLSEARLGRVFDALKERKEFGASLAATGSAWQRRREFHATRVHDDDWFFERFADSCHV